MAEYLVIDAELSWDGEFENLFSYTTPQQPHSTPSREGDAEPLQAIVLNKDSEEVATSRLRRYEPPESDPLEPVWDVRGVVPLPAGSSGIRIASSDGEVIAGFELGRQPELRVDVDVSKDQSTAYVRSEYDPCPSGSWMVVSLLSEDQGPRTVHLGEPRETVEAGLGERWGNEVRVGVLFSTGTRAAAFVSEPIPIESSGLPLVIGSPRKGQVVSVWDYVDCAVALRFPIRNASEILESVRWTVDGEDAGSGRLVTIGPMAPGKHEIEATVDSVGEAPGGSDSVVVTVREPKSAPRKSNSD